MRIKIQIQNLLFFIFLCTVNFIITCFFKLNFCPILYSITLLFCLNFLLIYLFFETCKLFIEKSGFLFIAFFFIKILAILIFISLLKKSFLLEKLFYLNFSILYLCSLFFSMFICLKVLKYFNKNKI